MEKVRLTKDQLLCFFSIAIVVLAQASEKILMVAVTPSKTIALVLALVYTALTAVVFFMVSSGKDAFLGMLAAMFGYKMMPPMLSVINSQTLDGAMLYFILRKAAAVLFVVLVYKFYTMQNKPRDVKPVPLVVIMLAVPFFNEITSVGYGYLMTKTGNMLYVYFLSYACYIAASLIILAVAYQSGYKSLRFAAYFEFAAFGVNIFRQLGKIGYYAILGEHISRSFYGWIIIYVALIVFFAVALNMKKKAEA